MVHNKGFMRKWSNSLQKSFYLILRQFLEEKKAHRNTTHFRCFFSFTFRLLTVILVGIFCWKARRRIRLILRIVSGSGFFFWVGIRIGSGQSQHPCPQFCLSLPMYTQSFGRGSVPTVLEPHDVKVNYYDGIYIIW